MREEATNKTRKIYIAGKVSGMEEMACRAKFYPVKHRLVAEGYAVVCPLDLVPWGTEWTAAMRVCIKALMDCDAIYLLDNWRESKGAVWEAELATMLGMERRMADMEGRKSEVFRQMGITSSKDEG